MNMPWRLRVLGAVLNRAAEPVEEVTDHAAARARRRKLWASPAGAAVFGRADSRVTVEDLDIALPGRTLRARVYRPSGVGDGLRPVVVNYHGGGWVQGEPEQSEWFASRVAARTGAVVISPSYRLAPEYPYPAAVDDAWEALCWIVEHAERLGVDAGRVAVMGDSAGGNLAAVTAMTARDKGGPEVGAQILIYPAVEMYEKYASEIAMPDAPVLTSANMRAFVRLYLQDAYGTDDQQASPLRAGSHEALPPAFILTASADPLLDNGVHYRDALRRAGVQVRYREYDAAIHGFVSLPGLMRGPAHAALDDVTEYLAEHLVVG
ncbi:alpha/beta hydrolase [Aeromicrobium sp. YIM 150415]|uniref:alpha/beta hydrolase n=1 Tax=Aeromicrobium sp. YIM 150415 TaxID=2803912 RepID=UPI001966BD71|nr:alpha/beta hydrolase [Aeromicrobium sp. YIM 150415]MBM9463132.1 alpha/beta hydrolase [Aeromicrobium sp. YIM 150415]